MVPQFRKIGPSALTSLLIVLSSSGKMAQAFKQKIVSRSMQSHRRIVFSLIITFQTRQTKKKKMHWPSISASKLQVPRCPRPRVFSFKTGLGCLDNEKNSNPPCLLSFKFSPASNTSCLSCMARSQAFVATYLASALVPEMVNGLGGTPYPP